MRLKICVLAWDRHKYVCHQSEQEMLKFSVDYQRCSNVCDSNKIFYFSYFHILIFINQS